MTAKPPSPGPFRFTRKQYYEMGKLGYFDGKRVELIFGEIVEISPIGWLHRVGCRKTAERLEQIFAGVAWIDRAEPLDLTHSDPNRMYPSSPAGLKITTRTRQQLSWLWKSPTQH